ncbi:hypothetical protein [Lactobacillus plantarum] [Lactiplantibacillus mudanjiangensis]|uniref:hypothetical protein n=1 Tax=Lactiplantibacillus mudanjiangensis TaxID=1296538 RepID=UPI00101410DA|nr:hypothetical protein [Lactiplantibacillus mudanjiangensis]VDG31328.1 hypothetical protein [Lactobacillus plantarum] [Lactiplantibacillus mudanjiangensis]
MQTISDSMRSLLLTNKGMASVKTLADATGVNRFTLTDILTGKRNIVRNSTYDKLDYWLKQSKK